MERKTFPGVPKIPKVRILKAYGDESRTWTRNSRVSVQELDPQFAGLGSAASRLKAHVVKGGLLGHKLPSKKYKKSTHHSAGGALEIDAIPQLFRNAATLLASPW